MKLTRTVLLLLLVLFFAVFLFFPLAYSCRAAFFDGSWLLASGDVRDWPSFARALSEPDRSPTAAAFWEDLSEEEKNAAHAVAEGEQDAVEAFQASVNGLLDSPDLLSVDLLAGLGLGKDGLRLLEKRRQHLSAEAVQADVEEISERFSSLAAEEGASVPAEFQEDLSQLEVLLGLDGPGGAPGGSIAERLAAAEQTASSRASSNPFTEKDAEKLNRKALEAAFPETIRPLRGAHGHFTLVFFKYLYTDALTRQAIVNSFAIGCLVTLFAAAIAMPLAMMIVRYRFPGKSLLTALLLVPMIMPPFVGAIGMRQFLARFGSVNLLLMDLGLLDSPIDWLGGARFWGVIIMEVLHLYPIMYLNFAAALANVDPSLEEAAVNMGSSGFRLFRKITLPLMMPGLFAGSVLVFIWAFTDLGTPLIFGYERVVPVQIFNQVTELTANPKGYALVVGVLMMTLLVFLTAKRFFGVRSYQSLSKGRIAGSEKRVGLLGTILIVGFIVSVVAAACLPHLSVVLSSLKQRWFMTVLPTEYTLTHFEDALGHHLTLPSIYNSIRYSSLSTLLDLVLGILIAYLLVRHSFRGANLLDAVVMLPLAVPGLVLAFGYVAAFSELPIDPDQNWLIRWLQTARNQLDPRENPVPLLVIAYGVRRLPYMVRAAYAGFQQVDVELEEAAVNLGSPPLWAMTRITVPLVSANLIAGGILAFSFAMLEVSDSLILAMKEQFYPITKAIYSLVSRIEDGAYIASALGVWAMVFLGLSLLTASVLLGRRMGQLFRV